ncbi:MAG: prephenate dehydrogenase/arogenate dehydrogenase family protein, partial [SAR86 cluster bacterium]|nr:prephenate dehydrogenase/arogenate dehydrogenase family protein [SAR86 cluster bacterium]
MKAFENILIFGLGLIGGSIAKKLKDSSYPGKIYGFDKDPLVLKKAQDQGLILNNVDLNLENTKDLLVVFSVPVLSFRDALETALPLLPREHIVFTDTLSTKTEVFEILNSDYQEVLNKFVLSHPIAGSEKSSIEFSNLQLFDQKVAVISPHQYNNQEDIDRVIG